MKISHHPDNLILIDLIEIPLGTFYFYDRIIIAELRRGVHLTFEEAQPIVAKALELYENKGFGYISNRLHPYSVVPTDYFKLSKLDSIKAFAVVSYSILNRENAELEKLFFDKAFSIFSDLNEAVAWMKDIICVTKPMKKN
ncbi:hypothetical protein GCM10009117_09990 [Gangjinia marincola]|uniref:STAS/SEC14 domain-containing protein n=1 Tax=Gangjinia marincola TaxID=578463 RepID=A0ABP3XUH3_9FLAO